MGRAFFDSLIWRPGGFDPFRAVVISGASPVPPLRFRFIAFAAADQLVKEIVALAVGDIGHVSRASAETLRAFFADARFVRQSRARVPGLTVDC
jgi:hypothetical protein